MSPVVLNPVSNAPEAPKTGSKSPPAAEAAKELSKGPSKELSKESKDLLSKQESNDLHAFLDSMDYENTYVSREWAMYAQNPEPDQQHDRTQLTKATKDLMALDSRGYGHPPQQPQQQQNYQQYYYQQQQQQQQQIPHLNYSYEHPHHGSGYTRQPTFPFLQQQRQPPPPPHPLTVNHPQPRQYIHTPSTASASTSSYSFPPLSQEIHRPSPKHSQSQQLPQHPIQNAPTIIPPTQKQRSRHAPAPPPPPAKPALLSPSQKKANHIMSEQKRRANIRRGYEALCETVPALRDAIREEEALTGVSHASSSSKSKRSRRGRTEDGVGGSEKIDGRAGPRSENVVLSKTIDYMNELRADHDALRARLDRARAALPPGHPARVPAMPDPLWEREWKGGLGLVDEDAGEDDDEESS